MIDEDTNKGTHNQRSIRLFLRLNDTIFCPNTLCQHKETKYSNSTHRHNQNQKNRRDARPPAGEGKFVVPTGIEHVSKV